LNHKVI